LLLDKLSIKLDEVNRKYGQVSKKVDSNLRDLSSPSGRLAEYLAYLGLSYKDLEAHYGINHSTWQVAATTGKKASSTILDVLTSKEPPKGKHRPRSAWLVSGDGPMLQFTKAELLAASERMEAAKPADSFRWMAEKATAGALAERGLDKRATADQRELLASHLARSAAAGATAQELQKELTSYLDLLQAAIGRKEPK
jgi:hypothetical protein